MKVRTFDTVVFVRMTKPEAAKLKAHAKRDGFSSLSEWVRVTLKKVTQSN